MGQKRNSSTMEEREARKRARMERNRLSAARHRQQQRDLIASLQQQLAAALAYAQRMDTAVAAKTLMIFENKLGTAGVRAIGKVIEAGALPRLEDLHIDKNGADDETREWIKTVARGAGCSEVLA